MNEMIPGNLVQEPESTSMIEEKRYWLKQLSGELVKTGFPCDTLTDTGKPANSLESIPFPCADDLYRKLDRVSNKSATNLLMVLMAGLNALLYKYTGHEDIIVATPIYKQEAEGSYINTVLFIRSTLTAGIIFKELLLKVRRTLFEANEHLNYPVEQLLYHLDIQGPREEISLAETALLLENLQDRSYLGPIHPTVVFSFLKRDDGLQGTVEDNPRLYKKETMEKVAVHFSQLLYGWLENPALTLRQVDIMTAEERKWLLTELDGMTAAVPIHKTPREWFDAQADRTPDRLALVGLDKEICYRRLAEETAVVGRYLREKGLQPDNFAAILMTHSVEMITALLGILKAGGAFLPVNPEHPVERIKYMLHDSRISILITDHAMDPVVKHLEGKNEQGPYPVKALADILANPPANAASHPGLSPVGDETGIAYMIYTSGTTGQPKGVQVENRNLVNYVAWFQQQISLTEKDKTVLMSSFAFDLGYTAIFPAVLGGAELHILPRDMYLYAEKLLHYTREKKITYLKSTPSLFTLIVNSPGFSREMFQSMRWMVLGGEEIMVKDVETALRACPHLRILNHYGPTETTIGSVACPVDPESLRDYREAPAIGKPISNTRAYIVDKDMNLLPPGVPGELCLAGKGVARGYWGQPQLTAEKFLPNPWKEGERLYRTGDRARYLPGGDIQFLGRRDQQIKIRGFRVELGEIISHLQAYRGVNEAVVIPSEGTRGNKYLCAYLTANKPLSGSAIREYLLPRLPDYMIPSYFIQLEKLPLTPNGKLDRKALPSPGTLRREAEYDDTPGSELERLVGNIWKEVLGVEFIGPQDNFFDLGGNSLDIITVGTRIKEATGKEIPIITMFSYPTAATLAEYLAGTVPGEPAQAPQKPGGEALEKSRDLLKQTAAKMKIPGK